MAHCHPRDQYGDRSTLAIHRSKASRVDGKTGIYSQQGSHPGTRLYRSLAKGYKGPPKQHFRFDPTDFDVDANLYAPALAEYAVRVDGQTPDRERIFGRNTSNRPLHDFSDKIQKELVNRIDGIEEDPNDLFDVAIYATSTPEQLDYENRLQEMYDFRALSSSEG